MNPYADMYPDEWTPPCPKEEQEAEEWKEHVEHAYDTQGWASVLLFSHKS